MSANKDKKAALHEHILDIDGLEVWSILPLLDILREEAEKRGLEFGVVECEVRVDVSWFDGHGDFKAFQEALDKRHIAFGQRPKRPRE